MTFSNKPVTTLEVTGWDQAPCPTLRPEPTGMAVPSAAFLLPPGQPQNRMNWGSKKKETSAGQGLHGEGLRGGQEWPAGPGGSRLNARTQDHPGYLWKGLSPGLGFLKAE